MIECPILLNHDNTKLEGSIKLSDSCANYLALGIAELVPSFYRNTDGSITLRSMSIVSKQNYNKEQ